MEARASFGKTGISKLFVGVVLVIVAVGLGIMAAYLASNLTGTAGATQPVNSAPGSILRHDNGRELDQAPAPATTNYAGHRGGALEE